MNPDEETTANFWEVFGKEHLSSPEPVLFYRLYYNEQGHPLFYSMEDVPGNYVEIDRQTFANPPKHAKIIDGALTNSPPAVLTKKMVPSETTGSCCLPTNVSIVVDRLESHQLWNSKLYEQE